MNDEAEFDRLERRVEALEQAVADLKKNPRRALAEDSQDPTTVIFERPFW